MPKYRKPRWNPAKSAAENARLKLPEMAGAYFDAGRKAAKGRRCLEDLHRFRLATKRFRYTLELFQSSYGAGLDRYIAPLRKIQNFLGEINDCAATLQLLEDRIPERSAQNRTLTRFLQRRTAKLTADFRRYWKTDFDAPGDEARWKNYLARSAGGKRSGR